MKKLIVAGVLVVAGVVLADRTDVWISSSVKVQRVELHLLLDGGCGVEATAMLRKQDGGVMHDSSDFVEVTGASRIVCLDVLNRAEVLFKSQKGL